MRLARCVGGAYANLSVSAGVAALLLVVQSGSVPSTA